MEDGGLDLPGLSPLHKNMEQLSAVLGDTFIHFILKTKNLKSLLVQFILPMEKLRFRNIKLTCPFVSQVVNGRTDTRAQFCWSWSNRLKKGDWVV